MSEDPYHEVQQEIQTSLATASTLRASYVRIRSMGLRDDSEELTWARNELKATLASLDADLEALDQSVKIVESTDARLFGLKDAEVLERRRYVQYVTNEIENMRADVLYTPLPSGLPPAYSSLPPSRVSTPAAQSTRFQTEPRSQGENLLTHPRATGSRPSSPRADDNRDEDHQGAWAREEQQLIMREQDRTIDSIAGALSNLAQQAGLMGQEINEHVELLDDLEEGVNRTDGKLSDAMRRMRRFMRQTEETKSGWCVILLIVVLLILLLAIILV